MERQTMQLIYSLNDKILVSFAKGVIEEYVCEISDKKS